MDERRTTAILKYKPIIAGLAAASIITAIVLLFRGPAWRGRVMHVVEIRSGIEFREVFFSGPGSESFHVDCIILPRQGWTASIVDQPIRDDGRPTIRSIAEQHNALVAINGGYFDAEFHPDGLCVIDHVEYSPRSTKPVLSGLVFIGEPGQLRLQPMSREPLSAANAIQSGPFLVEKGVVGIHDANGIRARRTIIASGTDGQTVILSASAVSLRTLAERLVSDPQFFGVHGIDQVLNLDGGPSSSMFVKLPTGTLVVSEEGPVRNAILIQ